MRRYFTPRARATGRPDSVTDAASLAGIHTVALVLGGIETSSVNEPPSRFHELEILP